MARVNRQWIVNQRPRGDIDAQTFVLREQTLPSLAPGEVLVKTLYIGFDPAQRGWLDDVPSYMPPVPLGEPMRAVAVGQVVDSRNDDYPKGALVTGLTGWQEYVHCTAESVGMLNLLPEGTPPTYPLSIFGGTSMTAYFGLLDVGRPEAGETLVVSGAAGATGSVVCQLGKIKGCRVIGIAGGSEKCRWLKESCGVDETIDYRSESIDERLKALCPDGIDLFFDNVGGKTLETLIDNMADHGRIVLCGSISGYNDAEPSAGPRNMFQVIARRLTLRGFIAMDFMDQLDRFNQAFGTWVAEGRIAWREDIQEGFENIPATLQRLFEGRNQGKQLLKVADPD